MLLLLLRPSPGFIAGPAGVVVRVVGHYGEFAHLAGCDSDDGVWAVGCEVNMIR